jgi:hypothetical protein
MKLFSVKKAIRKTQEKKWKIIIAAIVHELSQNLNLTWTPKPRQAVIVVLVIIETNQ